MDRKPYLEVNGSDGSNLVPVWGSRLIGVKIVDRGDDATDEATFMFTNKPPYMAAPTEGTPYTVKVGWSATDVGLTGYYTLQRIHRLGNPAQGEQVHYVCRAADLSGSNLKQVDSQHFSADNGNKTLGDVFNSLFAASGTAVQVASSIASTPIPGGYLLRWNQSAIDFGTDLANNNGAVLKPMGGKMIVMQRDAGQSADDQTLATITIMRDPSYEYDVEIEPLFEYQGVKTSWLDKDQGKLKTEQSQSQGSTGGTYGHPHPAASQDGAQALGKAIAAEMRRFTGTGLFVMPGNPAAVGMAPVSTSGYPDPIDTIKWQAICVTHDITPDKGWTTSVEAETNGED